MPEEKIFPNPPAGETFLSKPPSIWEEIANVAKQHWRGEIPMPFEGTIPVGGSWAKPGILEGPTRGVTEATRGVFNLFGELPASAGGITYKNPLPLRSMPKYSLKEQILKGDPDAFTSVVSDAEGFGVYREGGELTPKKEGMLVEKLNLTSKDPVKHLDELFDLIGTLTEPGFKTRLRAPRPGK